MNDSSREEQMGVDCGKCARTIPNCRTTIMLETPGFVLLHNSQDPFCAHELELEYCMVVE